MSGDCFWFLRVRQSMLSDHIRRIAGNTVKGSSRENLVCFLDVSCHDVNAILQVIQCHAASRHICALLLDFQSGEMRTVVFCLHQKRDDPGACAKVKHRIPFSGMGKSCQKHRIHTETKFLRILYDLITVPLKVIDPLFFLQFNLHSCSPVFFRYRYYRCCRLFCRRVSVFCGKNCPLVPVPGCRTVLCPEHRCSLLPAPDGSADDSHGVCRRGYYPCGCHGYCLCGCHHDSRCSDFLHGYHYDSDSHHGYYFCGCRLCVRRVCGYPRDSRCLLSVICGPDAPGAAQSAFLRVLPLLPSPLSPLTSRVPSALP